MRPSHHLAAFLTADTSKTTDGTPTTRNLTSLHIINFPETFPATHIHRRCRDSETHSRTEVCFHRT